MILQSNVLYWSNIQYFISYTTTETTPPKKNIVFLDNCLMVCFYSMAIVALVVGIIPIPPVSMLHMFVFSGEAANTIFKTLGLTLWVILYV